MATPRKQMETKQTLRRAPQPLNIDVATPLRAWFDDEVARLVKKFETRIKAGEFDQWNADPASDEAETYPFIRLEVALQACAPCGKDSTALLVLAASHHRAAAAIDVTMAVPGADRLWGAAASTALAHDLLDEAARRGWIEKRDDWTAFRLEGKA